MRIDWLTPVAAALLLSGCAPPAEFRALVAESRAAEGEQVLKQAYVLQEAYRVDNARYAATLDELREVGWETPAGLRFYQPPRIVHAQAGQLCMVIEPTQADLWPQHVDQTGEVRRGACP